MTFSRIAALALACILPFAAGCRPSAPHPAPQPSGSIHGLIAFTGTLPIPPATNPHCYSLQTDRQFFLEDHMLPRALPPVFLWISAGLENRSVSAPHEQAVLTQIHCGLQPQILGVLPGRPVYFTNSDPFPAHLRVEPHTAGNPTLNLNLPPKTTGQVHSFPHPELMIPVTATHSPSQGAPAHAYLNVVPNPYFTLSGPQGHFRLRNLPPGTYTLSAIRPGYPTQSQSVLVKAGVAAQITFTFPAKTPPPAHN